jgi:hypothetical protein
MTARLFCSHCNKYFEVDLSQIRLIQSINEESFSFAHNTYFYESENCFFKTLNSLQSTQK